MFVNNKKSTKDFRRQLRKNQTEAEQKLWDILRNRKVNGLKFFRQYGVGIYILDFYCPAIKLAIEIDGGQHNQQENMDSDNNRSKFLESFGIKVIRFWNNDIMNNIEGVYELLIQTINSPRPSL